MRKEIIVAAFLGVVFVLSLQADVAITAQDIGSQQILINVVPSGDAIVWGVALRLTISNGSINSPTDFLHSDFTTFCDTESITYPAAIFYICAGYIDPNDGQGGFTSQAIVARLQLSGIPNNQSATVVIEADTLRGGPVAGDNLGTVTVSPSQTVAGPIVVEAITTPTVTKPTNGGYVNGGRVESFTASNAVSSFGHALQYQFTWGDSSVSTWGAATQTHTYTYTAAGTYAVTVQARCAADTSVLSAISAPLTVTREGVKSTALFYTDWKTFGRPDCWLYPRNCKGDADGKMQGSAKSGYIAVYTDDLAILTRAYRIWEPPMGPGILSVPNGICADFNHSVEGICEKGNYCPRVYTRDLTILSGNYNKKEPTFGMGVPVCPSTDYHFFVNP